MFVSLCGEKRVDICNGSLKCYGVKGEFKNRFAVGRLLSDNHN